MNPNNYRKCAKFDQQSEGEIISHLKAAKFSIIHYKIPSMEKTAMNKFCNFFKKFVLNNFGFLRQPKLLN